ncbi:MAG: cytochrome c oxidase subunit I [Chloroflexaceae bacterium]|nr:cytochrome c oxidase subunit I [Chloroflexaceae bacterium]NJO04469.1 cytochrome c oxidase subunit I [Chloroflexaceae bacterium]
MATISVPQHSIPWTQRGIMSWITTVDHKKIGIIYMTLAFFFFIVSGLLAMVVRLELTVPGQQFVSADLYNQIFTMHATGMIFLFVIPFFAGLGNFLVPLQIGAIDMAFPRINALGLWMALFSGIIMFGGFFVAGGAAAAGWTSYPPLSNSTYSPTLGQDLWIIGLQVLGISSILSAVNFLVTVANMRAPGMTWRKIPLFTWSVVTAQGMVLAATPMLTGALTMLLTDRQFGTRFFDAAQGNPRLWQHMFWFYSHPAVYIMILPAMGAVSDILPVFSRKPIFGYFAIFLSTVLIGVFGFTSWLHHMFTIGANPVVETLFMATTIIIAVPTGLKIFNWIATMWGGSLNLKTPLYYVLGFLSMFLIGGISGVFQGSVPLDKQLHDTYWVVAHIHYVLFGGSVFGIFAALFYWWPKFTGRMLGERLGMIQFWTMFIGMNVTFFPMHILGLLGMPRRYFDYPAGRGWEIYNIIATVGAFLVALSALLFIINVVISLTRGERASDDPWEGNTLEWATSSPPPDHNFDKIPPLTSDRPLWDLRVRKLGIQTKDIH